MFCVEYILFGCYQFNNIIKYFHISDRYIIEGSL